MEPSKRTFADAQHVDHRSGAADARRSASSISRSAMPAPTARSRCGIYHKPLVLLIWLGAVVMVLGGALSLSDRRLRVGAPKPAQASAALQPAE